VGGHTAALHGTRRRRVDQITRWHTYEPSRHVTSCAHDSLAADDHGSDDCGNHDGEGHDLPHDDGSADHNATGHHRTDHDAEHTDDDHDAAYDQHGRGDDRSYGDDMTVVDPVDTVTRGAGG
jgi:hypothetical protein